MKEIQANCANVIFWKKSPRVTCLLLPEAWSSGKPSPYSSLLIPQGSRGRRQWVGRGGEGRALRGPIAGWPRLPCALRLASMSFCLFPQQYFSTLESSIVSLFVLLTTAK